MMLTTSDVESTAKLLGRWEVAEYIFSGFVAIACFGEYVGEFPDWFTKECKHRISKVSTWVLIAALALELVCVVKTNSLYGMLVGSLADKAAAADSKAQSALNNSSAAQPTVDAVGKRATCIN